MKIIDVKKHFNLTSTNVYSNQNKEPLVTVISILEKDEIYDFSNLCYGDICSLVISTKFDFKTTTSCIKNLSQFFTCGGAIILFSDISGLCPEGGILNSLFIKDKSDLESFIVDIGNQLVCDYNTPTDFW